MQINNCIFKLIIIGELKIHKQKTVNKILFILPQMGLSQVGQANSDPITDYIHF